MSSFPPGLSVPYPSAQQSARQYEMGPWVKYAPTWSPATSAATLGNGTSVGAWRRHGTTIFFRGSLTVGSTSTVGSGTLRLLLPSGFTFITPEYQVGAAFWNASTVNRGIALAEPNLTYFTFAFNDASAGRFPSEALASGHSVVWSGSFEVQP